MRSKAPPSILILTSSGGSGHLQAAKAKALEEKKLSPNAHIITIDLQLDWMGARIGQFFISLWNNAQAAGDVAKLARLLSCQWLSEAIFWVPIFLKAFFVFYFLKIERVIDTQPLFTSALIKAAKAAGRLQSRQIIVEKVITELPTELCSHFFEPIKKLSKRDKASLRIIAGYPLLSEDQSPEGFWQRACGIPESAVKYSDLPLRPSFQKFQQARERSTTLHLTLRAHSHEERLLIEGAMRRGPLSYLYNRGHFYLHLSPQDRVYTIMLGSIPAEKTTLRYVQEFIETIRSLESQEVTHLFVFCNNHMRGKKSLLKQVHDLILEAEDYPPNLTIIPMSFQDDSVIAPLFFRSDATFTRSGGLTSMELMAVSRGQICIHSESQDPYRLDKGMPKWEFGNARYLKEKRGAKILTSACFANTCRSLLINHAVMPLAQESPLRSCLPV